MEQFTVYLMQAVWWILDAQSCKTSSSSFTVKPSLWAVMQQRRWCVHGGKKAMDEIKEYRSLCSPIYVTKQKCGKNFGANKFLSLGKEAVSFQDVKGILNHILNKITLSR
ncbi:hypothetical protein Nmel_014139, partial [Mimus melanotis]